MPAGAPTRRELLLAALAAPVLAACGGSPDPPPIRWKAGDRRDLAVDTWNERVIAVAAPGGERLSVRVFLWLGDHTDEVRALDAACGCGPRPGGCPVSWADGSRRFICPCHGGIYGREGKPLGGPARRPLAARPVFVEGETVYVGPARR
ncbi:MAG TPA: Rieske 2Fe-2S domain-containing protein [Solirubrobacteraceae bacterium]